MYQKAQQDTVIQIYSKISVDLQYEIEEILLDVEINLKNHPLTYSQDNIHLKVLTPKSMILGENVSTRNSTEHGDSNE